MNRSGSLPIHENLPLYDRLPVQGLFRGTAGQGVFFYFAYQSATGAPHRGRQQPSCLRERVAVIPVLCLNTLIFMGNAQYQAERSTGISPPALPLP